MSNPDETPRAATQPVRLGGLMRCCTLTLAEIPAVYVDGTEVDCNYCHYPMVFAGGVWARNWEEMKR